MEQVTEHTRGAVDPASAAAGDAGYARALTIHAPYERVFDAVATADGTDPTFVLGSAQYSRNRSTSVRAAARPLHRDAHVPALPPSVSPPSAPLGVPTAAPRPRRRWGRWRRRAGVVLAALAGGAVARSATAGVLFPWSPLKPGYDAHPFAAGVVYAPHGVPLAPDYAPERLDRTVHALEASHGLRFVRPVRVIVARSWQQFNRGALIAFDGAPRAVLAAALQTGDVVYMSPLEAEPGRHPGWALAHELSHALLYQHVSLRESFALHRVRWLMEGMAVSTGNPGDYFGPAAFRGVVRAHPEYVFPPTADPHLERMPADTGGPFMLAEYRYFVEDLRARDGGARLRRLLAAVVARPDAPAAAFAATFGTRLDRAGADFVARVRAGVAPPGDPTDTTRAVRER